MGDARFFANANRMGNLQRATDSEEGCASVPHVRERDDAENPIQLGGEG